MKHEKISLEHDVPSIASSSSDSSNKKQKMKKAHPTTHIYHGKIPKGLKPGHKIVLHGVVKSVERSERMSDGEEPKDDANFAVELHHMEDHGPANSDHTSTSEDEDAIESGLKEAETKTKKK